MWVLFLVAFLWLQPDPHPQDRSEGLETEGQTYDSATSELGHKSATHLICEH